MFGPPLHHVLNDADYPRPVTLDRTPRPDELADRVLTGPHLLGHGSVDDQRQLDRRDLETGCGTRRLEIEGCECPSGQQRDSHRLVVAVIDKRVLDQVVGSCRGIEDIIVDQDAPVGAPSKGQLVGQSGSCNARNTPKLRQELLEEYSTLEGFVIVRSAQHDCGHHYIVSLEVHILRDDVVVAHHQHHCRIDQDETDGDLGRNEACQKPLKRTTASPREQTFAQHTRDFGPRGEQRRRQTGEQTCGDGGRAGEDQHLRVDADADDARDVVGQDRNEGTDTPDGKRPTTDTTEERMDEALGHQLAQNAVAFSADRVADRDFGGSLRPARHEHVGDVGAGDEQHQTDHDQQGAHGFLNFTERPLHHRLDPHPGVGVGVRVGCGKTSRDRLQLGVGVRYGCPVGQPCDPAERVPRSRGEALWEDQRSPEFAGVAATPRGWELEIVGHDADDLVRHTIDRDLPSNNIEVAAELTLSQSVAEDDDEVVALDFLLLDEKTAMKRRHTEQSQETGRARRTGKPDGGGVAGEIEPVAGQHSEFLKRAALPAYIEIVGAGEWLVREGPLLHLPHRHEALGFL